MGISFTKLLQLHSVFEMNKNNPEALAAFYWENEATFEQLKLEYPNWRTYLSGYETLVKQLNNLGVPL